MAVKEKIRVRLKSYDHTLIDTAAEKIVDVAKRNGATVSGPVPLPTEKEIVTILAPNSIRNQILEDVNREYGLKSEAQGTVLSVPVDKVFKI